MLAGAGGIQSWSTWIETHGTSRWYTFPEHYSSLSADWDADGRDDLLLQSIFLRLFYGGLSLPSWATPNGSRIGVTDVNGDGVDELLVNISGALRFCHRR